MTTIKRNAIRCAYCGHTLVSLHRHHFVAHICDGLRAKYGADGIIAADGGDYYLRRVGEPADYFEDSVVEYD